MKAGQLRLLLEDFEPPPMPVHVVHREGQHASKKARAFIDLIKPGMFSRRDWFESGHSER